MGQRIRRTFTEEQKLEAVRLVREVGNISKVSRDLGVAISTLRLWIQKDAEAAKPSSTGVLSADVRKELQRLRKENRIAQMEIAFLKKAAAFFAKESSPSN